MKKIPSVTQSKLRRMLRLLDRKIPLKLIKDVTYHRGKQKLSPLIVACALWHEKMIKKNVFHGHKSLEKHLTAHFSPRGTKNEKPLAEMKIVFHGVKGTSFIHETCVR